MSADLPVVWLWLLRRRDVGDFSTSCCAQYRVDGQHGYWRRFRSGNATEPLGVSMYLIETIMHELMLQVSKATSCLSR